MYLGQNVSRDGVDSGLLVRAPGPPAARLREQHGFEELGRVALRPRDGGVVVQSENFRSRRQRQALLSVG